MYDFDLLVPNLTSPEYSSDNRFLLLKNYLYELNTALREAFEEKEEGIKALKESVSTQSKKDSEALNIKLSSQSFSKFTELKEKIILTAQNIERDYTYAIEQSEAGLLSSADARFVSQSAFGEYSDEAQTAISQNAEAVELLSSETESIATDLNAYKKTAQSELALKADEIRSEVYENFVSNDSGEELEERISSQISQTVGNVNETFTQWVTGMKEDISSVGGQIKELISDLEVYIRRGQLEENVYGIEIGRSDSNIKARFTNDRLSFFQGFSEVAYISGNNLYITRGEILDYLKIGNGAQGYFLFDITENGLEVRWANGN